MEIKPTAAVNVVPVAPIPPLGATNDTMAQNLTAGQAMISLLALVKTLDTEMTVADLLPQLNTEANATLSRLQLQQLSMTPVDHSNDPRLFFQFEIPIKHNQRANIWHIEIEGEAQNTAENEKPVDRIWRIKIAFHLEQLGGIQVQAQIHQQQISVHCWSELASTKILLDQEFSTLERLLADEGLQVKDWQCQQGQPHHPGPQSDPFSLIDVQA